MGKHKRVHSTPSQPTEMQRYFAWVIVALSVFFGVLFVVYWRAGYNSDTILTGLMAKNVLVRGERPIFLWHMGYHGIIPNVYVTALFFQLFGVSPQVNLLFTLLTWWGLMYATYRYIESIWGRQMALVSVGVLLLSSIELYIKIMRSEPGYTESFLCGVLLLVSWRRAVTTLYVERRPLDRQALICLAGVGFCAGFGFYIYELTVYFVLAVIAQAGCMALRESLRDLRTKTPTDWILLSIGASGALFVLDGAQAFVRKAPPIIPIATLPLDHIGAGLATVATVIILDIARRQGKALLSLWPAPLALLGGALLGQSPRLYFKYVQHGETVSRTGLDNNFDMFVQRLAWAYDTNKRFLNIQEPTALNKALTIGWLALLAAFAVYTIKRWVAFTAGRTEREALRNLDPITLLPIVVLPIFGTSAAVYNWLGSRYTIVLYFYYALAVAWGVHWAFQQKRAWVTYASLSLAAFVAMFNGQHIIADLERFEREGFEAEDIVQALKERDIHYGYADYWAGYSVTFFTDEDIIMQPIFSAYAPAYGPIVAKADRLAIVQKVESIGTPANPWVNVQGRAMRITDTYKGKMFGFYIAEAEQPTASSAAN